MTQQDKLLSVRAEAKPPRLWLPTARDSTSPGVLIRVQCGLHSSLWGEMHESYNHGSFQVGKDL